MKLVTPILCDIKSYLDDSKLILSFAIKDLSDCMGKLDAGLKNVLLGVALIVY